MLTCDRCKCSLNPAELVAHHRRFHLINFLSWECALCDNRSLGFADALEHWLLDGHAVRKTENISSFIKGLDPELTNDPESKVKTEISDETPVISDYVAEENEGNESIKSEASLMLDVSIEHSIKPETPEITEVQAYVPKSRSSGNIAMSSNNLIKQKLLTAKPPQAASKKCPTKPYSVRSGTNYKYLNFMTKNTDSSSSSPQPPKHSHTCSKCATTLSCHRNMSGRHNCSFVSHVKLCMSIGPYTCNGCGYSSAFKQHVVQHTRIKCRGAKIRLVGKGEIDKELRKGLEECFPEITIV